MARAGLGMTGVSSGFRGRVFGSNAGLGRRNRRDQPKPISTTPGTPGAGETETELDEPPRHLPTSRIIPVPPDAVERIMPALFQIARFMSIFPAVLGALVHLYHLYHPPLPLPGDSRKPPDRIDYAVSALWAILTGYQCLYMTTGLLIRWRVYYPPFATLIRLLALQGICWPATQITCTIFDSEKRPLATWAVIGTCTCISRSVQIWVTSNLWWETRDIRAANARAAAAAGVSAQGNTDPSERRRGYWRRWRGGKWGGRTWDWHEVGRNCILPAGVVYFIMAWAEQLRRELEHG